MSLMRAAPPGVRRSTWTSSELRWRINQALAGLVGGFSYGFGQQNSEEIKGFKPENAGSCREGAWPQGDSCTAMCKGRLTKLIANSLIRH